MGGCRCTYRNCKVKSDGKTHMFHYPVFEKVRCHQWLLNAHKLDFLDLKVSQLKNRVICQHHFKDENFMNFKKDKLTFDAIPTEDGPYCDPTNYTGNYQDSKSKLYCIIVDDIEDDITGCDKKAQLSKANSMKYGDFLTNLDVMDIEKTEQDSITYKHENNSLDILLPHEENERDKLINDGSSFVFKLSLPDKCDRKTVTQPMLAVPPYINSCIKSSMKQPKVTIISEKKITKPVPITGKFEPVSPNFVLNVSKVKRDGKTNIAKPTINESKNVPGHKECKEPFVHKVPKELGLQEPSVPNLNKTIEIEIEPLKIEAEDVSRPTSSVKLQNKIVFDKPSKVSLLKPRVPPERVEAINKKRKFNMKLRDIIESCLDKLENSDKASEESNSVENIKTKKKVQHTSHKESPILTNQEYTIAFLETRMRKMENTLLEKIDQNSEKINDLKNFYVKASSSKKSAQTRVDEEAHKKQLFQEISKYLSPSSKSLIYEELFINKFAVGEANTSPKRKRRR